MRLGSQALRRRLEDSGLSALERSFLDSLRPVLEAPVADDQRMFVGGAASLLDDASADELRAFRGLLELLERRRTLLDVVAAALDSRRPVRPRRRRARQSRRCSELALVGSAYGLSTRTLGTVSLLGPRRMDYERAISSVRAAASELSRLSESMYDED